MKIEIESPECEGENFTPIQLKDVVYGLNSKNQFCLSFASENHKYLDIESTDNYDFSSKEARVLRTIHCSQDGSYSGNYSLYSILNIKIIPESKEDSVLVENTIAEYFPVKWGYNIVFINYEDYYPSTKM